MYGLRNFPRLSGHAYRVYGFRVAGAYLWALSAPPPFNPKFQEHFLKQVCLYIYLY